MPAGRGSVLPEAREQVAHIARPGSWPDGFAATDSDRESILILSHLESLTPRELHSLARIEGSGVGCLRAVRAGRAGSAGDRDAIREVDAGSVRHALDSSGSQVAFPGCESYPDALLDLVDPPACLFLRGRPLREAPSIAIVGARVCSPYGRELASSLGGGLAAAGVTVVSGAALGIDAAAHRGALRANGRTVAVLGSGIDVPYPRSNRGLIDEIAGAGTVVSEYPPGTRPVPRRFPARNRIVAALSRAVLVVEGAAGSGSIHTAEFGMEMDREVMAVPGPVTSPLSEAPHALIRDGATLVRGPDDALGVMGLQSEEEAEETPDLSEEERRVLGAMAGTGLTLEGVATEAGIPPGSAMAVLVELELRGLVRTTGGRYERVGQEIRG
jgi:DNA processing protein